MENKFFSGVIKTLNVMAWATLGVIAIGVAIAYFTDHQISVVHNENPSIVSTVEPVGDGNKDGG